MSNKINMSVPIDEGNMDLRVTAFTHEGGREYQEDRFSIAYHPPLPSKPTTCCTLVDYGGSQKDQRLFFSYFGVFDGHGGPEAAMYAKKHLMDEIIAVPDFWSDDDDKIKNAIRTGFQNTQRQMHKVAKDWPTSCGKVLSPAGTTASIAFIRQGKLFIGQLGDSGIALGHEDNTVQTEDKGSWMANMLTTDHKPSDQAEKDRITECGGQVALKNGVSRVVWIREYMNKNSTNVNIAIPYLSVSRSLGDLWSYDSTKDVYVVSPDPDVSVMKIDVNVHRCIILGSDGLWNVVSPEDAVKNVYISDTLNNGYVDRELQAILNQGCEHGVDWVNPSKKLVELGLMRWRKRGIRADNITVVTVLINPTSGSQ